MQNDDVAHTEKATEATKDGKTEIDGPEVSGRTGNHKGGMMSLVRAQIWRKLAFLCWNLSGTLDRLGCRAVARSERNYTRARIEILGE